MLLALILSLHMSEMTIINVADYETEIKPKDIRISFFFFIFMGVFWSSSRIFGPNLLLILRTDSFGNK